MVFSQQTNCNSHFDKGLTTFPTCQSIALAVSCSSSISIESHHLEVPQISGIRQSYVLSSVKLLSREYSATQLRGIWRVLGFKQCGGPRGGGRSSTNSNSSLLHIVSCPSTKADGTFSSSILQVVEGDEVEDLSNQLKAFFAQDSDLSSTSTLSFEDGFGYPAIHHWHLGGSGFVLKFALDILNNARIWHPSQSWQSSFDV